MGTKTEEYLRILAEGGDAPTDCCMTNTQALIAEAIERINNLGGGGAIVPLEDYVDTSTFTITDKDGLIEAINEGKGFYSNGNVMPTGEVSDLIFSGAIDNDKIILTSNLNYAVIAGTQYSLSQTTLNFDKNTGALDPTNPASMTDFIFPHADTSTPMSKVLTLGELTITIGSDTYTYNGTQDVNITIADGENMGF